MQPIRTAARAERRRRALLLAISVLVLLGTAPVFVHHVGIAAVLPLAEMDRVGAICLVALHLTLAPVHGVFHVLLVAGLLYAAYDRARAMIQLRRTLSHLRASDAAFGNRVQLAAADAGLNPRIVHVVPYLANPAFTAGLLEPQIYLDASLVGRLSDAELRGVLRHEAVHVRRRDPLRLSVVRFFALTLFWIPALRRLADDVGAEAELEADALAAGGEPLVLASALLTAARAALPSRAAAATAAIGAVAHPDLLPIRVRRLAGEPVAVRSQVTRRSLLGASLALALTWTSGLVVSHPLPAEREHLAVGTHVDCTHHGGWALLHLLCAHYVPGQPCDHARAPESHLHAAS